MLTDDGRAPIPATEREIRLGRELVDLLLPILELAPPFSDEQDAALGLVDELPIGTRFGMLVAMNARRTW